MPEFYKIDRGAPPRIEFGLRVFSLADAAGHMERLLKDPDFEPSYSQIADFTQVTKIDLSAQDIPEVAQKSIFSRSRDAPLSPRRMWPMDSGAGLGCFEKTRAIWKFAFFALLRALRIGYSRATGVLDAHKSILLDTAA